MKNDSNQYKNFVALDELSLSLKEIEQIVQDENKLIVAYSQILNKVALAT